MPLPSTMTPETSGAGVGIDLTNLSAEDARQTALRLSERRLAIDDEMEAHANVLKSNNATMTSRLVDAGGFPIASIDIVAVRTARARLIALRNDREDIEQQLRQLLEIALARRQTVPITVTGDRVAEMSVTSSAMAHVPGTNGALSINVPVNHAADDQSWAMVGGLIPFARVNSIAAASPAWNADLRVNDQVLRFGHIVATTAHRSETGRDLGNLPSAVQESVEVEVMVLRSEGAQASVKRLQLIPSSNWGGRGLLGCHLLPL